jgi:hypothetical protein
MSNIVASGFMSNQAGGTTLLAIRPPKFAFCIGGFGLT